MPVHNLPLAPHPQTFKENRDGRDILVGDIHGYFQALEQALEAINFDPRVDRLFAPGDLVDRGPDSLKARDWLERPCFHSVLGNHEFSHLLKAARTNRRYSTTLAAMVCEEDDWVKGAATARYTDLLQQLQTLPLAITVHTPAGKVGLVHAELPRPFVRWGVFVQALIANEINLTSVWCALWERYFDLRPNVPYDHNLHWVDDGVALFHGLSIREAIGRLQWVTGYISKLALPSAGARLGRLYARRYRPAA